MQSITDNKSFSRLFSLLKPWWGWIGLATTLVVIAAPCELFPAVVWGFVTDDIILKYHHYPFLHRWFSFNGLISPDHRYRLLFSAVTWLFVIYLIGETLETLEGYILNRVAQKFILGFRNRVYAKLQSQSLGYLYRQRTGDLMSRAMGDVDEIQSFIVSSIDTIFSEGLLWLGTVGYVFYLNWKVAAVSLAPLLVVYVLLRIFNKRIKPIYAAVRERLGDVSSRLQENLNGLVVIKIFGREKEEATRFGQATGEHYRQQVKALNARSLFFPTTHIVGFFSNVFMIGVGGYYAVKDGSFTVGDLVTFRAYWWRLFGPIQTLARLNDMIQRANAATRRVFEVLDAPEELPESPDARPVTTVTGNIEVQDVRFTYVIDSKPQNAKAIDNGNQKPAIITLNHVNLSVEPGKTVAICGPSGSGKSTILNLLLRFYDPDAGQILLDGVDLRSLKKEDFRRHFALVQQETFLFNDSIGDNIKYGHPNATQEQVITAARAANAHDFIMQTPAGYDTKVGERGVRLSGGQKQRISIARAFLANPAVLLLDEPTSSVEPDSEAAIIAALDRLMTGRTTVLTSHRPSLINSADVVYVVENGQVTASGSVAQLTAAGGWFARFIE